mmetsp:Transcript_8196/g.24167  ORF Transcript_8196/g.24167 Transcript_8196/m.24167 type:complete len:202 (+) Transcript_8196:69-674(+)
MASHLADPLRLELDTKLMPQEGLPRRVRVRRAAPLLCTGTDEAHGRTGARRRVAEGVLPDLALWSSCGAGPSIATSVLLPMASTGPAPLVPLRVDAGLGAAVDVNLRGEDIPAGEVQQPPPRSLMTSSRSCGQPGTQSGGRASHTLAFLSRHLVVLVQHTGLDEALLRLGFCLASRKRASRRWKEGDWDSRSARKADLVRS